MGTVSLPRSPLRLLHFTAVFALMVACSGSRHDSPAEAAPAVGGGEAGGPAEIAPTHACGDEACGFDEMCVETQGAVCHPLPPAGEQCRDGCVLTEHCCNCSAFACFKPRVVDCPDGPTCECLDRADGSSVLFDCSGDRRVCATEDSTVQVLCIRVALDEDPFADAGTP